MTARMRMTLRAAAFSAIIILAGGLNPAAAKKDDGVVRDVVYVQRSAKALHLDVHPPPGGAHEAPVVLVIHGGGFTGGWRAQITYLHSGLPPILIQTGTRDYFLEENQDLHGRLRALGEDVDIVVWDKAHHGFALYPASWPPASAERTAEFFREKLGAGGR